MEVLRIQAGPDWFRLWLIAVGMGGAGGGIMTPQAPSLKY